MRPAAHGWALSIAIPLVVGAAIPAAFPAAADATYLPQERVPTNSPVYRELERLMATYHRAPRSPSTRPLRVQEILAYLNALEIEHPEVFGDPAMIRIRREVDPDAPATRGAFLRITGDQDEIITASPYVSLTYDEDVKNRPDINRDYRIGVQIAASIDSNSIFVFDGYEGTASQGGRGTPNFGTLNAVIEGVDLNSWMEEAYAELAISKVRLLVGHTWLRWGPGRDGTLSLSDAAPALDMIRGDAGFARNWHGQWFVSLIDPGPQTYLAGHRVEWTFHSHVTIGLTELARFDGTSQGLLYFIPIVPYSFWEKRPKSVPPGAVPGDTTGLALGKNNILSGVDISWHVRPGFRLWGEFLIDDISFSRDYKPDMIGWQAGVEERWRLGDVDDRGRVKAIGVAVEYNRVNNFTYSAWHGHNFGNRGYPFGFLYGPDVMQVSAEAAYEHHANLELRLRAEWRRKGEGSIGDAWIPSEGKVDAGAMSGIIERDARLSAQLIYTPSRMIRLEATVGAASFKNEDHRNVGAETVIPFRVAAKLKW